MTWMPLGRARPETRPKRAPLEVGEKAWVYFDDGAGRACTIVSIEWVGSKTGSGWSVVGSASVPCKCCGAVKYKQTPAIDGAWFAKEKR